MHLISNMRINHTSWKLWCRFARKDYKKVKFCHVPHLYHIFVPHWFYFLFDEDLYIGNIYNFINSFIDYWVLFLVLVVVWMRLCFWIISFLKWFFLCCNKIISSISRKKEIFKISNVSFTAISRNFQTRTSNGVNIVTIHNGLLRLLNC